MKYVCHLKTSWAAIRSDYDIYSLLSFWRFLEIFRLSKAGEQNLARSGDLAVI